MRAFARVYRKAKQKTPNTSHTSYTCSGVRSVGSVRCFPIKHSIGDDFRICLMGTRSVGFVIRSSRSVGFINPFGRICNPTALSISICNAINRAKSGLEILIFITAGLQIQPNGKRFVPRPGIFLARLPIRTARPPISMARPPIQNYFPLFYDNLAGIPVRTGHNVQSASERLQRSA